MRQEESYSGMGGIDLRGRPLWFILLMLLAFFTPSFESARVPSRLKKEVKEADTPTEELVEAKISAVPGAEPPAAFDVRYFHAVREDKPSEIINRLIEKAIDINPHYSPDNKGVSLEKATAWIKQALPAAIKASVSLRALQALEATGIKLRISFFTDEHPIGSALAKANQIGNFLQQHGLIAVSMKAFRKAKLPLTSILANELTHFGATVLHFPDTNSLPWITNAEKSELETAIFKGLQSLFTLPASLLIQILENPQFSDAFPEFLQRIMCYKIRTIENIIEKMRKELEGKQKEIFEMIMELTKLCARPSSSMQFYIQRNQEEQLAECNSDIASLTVSLPEEVAKKTFSAWFAYHDQLSDRYLSKHLPKQEPVSRERSKPGL